MTPDRLECREVTNPATAFDNVSCEIFYEPIIGDKTCVLRADMASTVTESITHIDLTGCTSFLQVANECSTCLPTYTFKNTLIP
jgi:hypothetical protein